MTLVRWQPGLRNDPFTSIDRLFGGFFGDAGGSSPSGGWAPAVDLAETDSEIVLTADLPGLGEDDIEIEIEDGVLSISGEREDRRVSDGKGYRRVERRFGRFSRAVRLPRDTDPEKIDARFDNGVLEVRIAKPEARKPHRVEIGAGEIEAEATEKSDSK